MKKYKIHAFKRALDDVRINDGFELLQTNGRLGPVLRVFLNWRRGLRRISRLIGKIIRLFMIGEVKFRCSVANVFLELAVWTKATLEQVFVSLRSLDIQS